MAHLPVILTLLSAVSILVSIRASQIIQGLALLALVVLWRRIRAPRMWIPLALFLLGTLLSLAVSPDPMRGMPQVKKLYVYLMLPLAYTTLKDVGLWRKLVLAWGALAGIIGLVSIGQFAAKWAAASAAGRDFYDYYVVERITGFMSHWMTFGGEQMFVLLLLMALLLFAPTDRLRWLWGGCALVIAVSLLLGMTRSIWLGTATGVGYLLWMWRRWALAIAPVAALLVWLIAPQAVRTRMASIARPAKVDSNQHRVVTFRTGLAMIKAHPWLGVGPEIVNKSFEEWVPADIPRPLPEGYYGHLHNFYLHYAAERGIPTLLALMSMLGLMLYDFGSALWRWSPATPANDRGAVPLDRGRPPGRPAGRSPAEGFLHLSPNGNRSSDIRFLLHGAIAVVLSTLVAGLFEHNLGDSEVLTMFLLTAAAGYVARNAALEIEARQPNLRT
ncbi:MAG: O-antigen ligase family protein [Bryobacteraceae bacterium]